MKGKALLWLCKVLERVQPSVDVDARGRRLRFCAPNTVALWRAETLLDKEPETLDWIDGFDDGDVLYDVGANVGLYTVYAAASKPKTTVLAFEPTYHNYWLLNRNVALNGLQERVWALSLALAGREALDRLHMPATIDGSALVGFGGRAERAGEPVFTQAALGMTLDGFIARFSPPFPNRLKLDVDGLEPQILEGASKTLADARLKSVLVEVDEDAPSSRGIAGPLEKAGLSLVSKRQSSLIARSAFGKTYNCVFARQ